mmetsp:Transcript_8242/g.9138  ORF Transcript_8242/g.9138 Transcript_8242/m.9138 type:complete len:248 (-) Transcript_8242:120-863(-)
MVNNNNKRDDNESSHLLFVEHENENENENQQKIEQEQKQEQEQEKKQEMEEGTDYRMRLLLLPASLLFVLLFVMVATSFFSSSVSIVNNDKDRMDIDDGAISLLQFHTLQSSVNAECSKEGGPCDIGMSHCCKGFNCSDHLHLSNKICTTYVEPVNCPVCVGGCDGCINCPKCLINCSGCQNCPTCSGYCEYCNNCPKWIGGDDDQWDWDADYYDHHPHSSCTNCPECATDCYKCNNNPTCDWNCFD